jgi:tetratricopeptide (TPR) repeat protein
MDLFQITIHQLLRLLSRVRQAGGEEAYRELLNQLGVEVQEEEEEEEEGPEVEFARRLSQARGIKARGNELFRDGQYARALDAYNEALAMLENFENSPASVREERDREQIRLLLNRAAAELKLNDNERCIADCNAVLAREPTNLKAIFRRALAYYQSRQIALAREDVERGLAIYPNNSDLHRLRNLINSASSAPEEKH